MIIFKKFGKTIKIRNDDWRKLRERFNPKNAVLNVDSCEYEIKRKCPLCSRYAFCDGCPFDEFGEYGCISFLERIFPNEEDFDTSDRTKIGWWQNCNKEATKQLTKIQKMMDKIEESQ